MKNSTTPFEILCQACGAKNNPKPNKWGDQFNRLQRHPRRAQILQELIIKDIAGF